MQIFSSCITFCRKITIFNQHLRATLPSSSLMQLVSCSFLLAPTPDFITDLYRFHYVHYTRSLKSWDFLETFRACFSSRSRKKSLSSSLSLFMIDARPENFSTENENCNYSWRKDFLPHLTGVFSLAQLLFMDPKTTELSIWCWARVVKVSPQTRMEKSFQPYEKLLPAWKSS